ncbi:MAG: hypothetical protein P8172_13810, partial [Gammaproteobacteria bacterium]
MTGRSHRPQASRRTQSERSVSRAFPKLVTALLLATIAVAAVPLAAAPMDPQLRDRLEAALRAAEPGDESERPFSLVIKGGISLGSYEAGVNWALLRLLRDLGEAARTGTDLRPQLLAAAGASAGAINGFLAGLMWCTESAGDGGEVGGAADTLAANLIRDTWRRVDVDTLLRHGAATEG